MVEFDSSIKEIVNEFTRNDTGPENSYSRQTQNITRTLELSNSLRDFRKCNDSNIKASISPTVSGNQFPSGRENTNESPTLNRKKVNPTRFDVPSITGCTDELTVSDNSVARSSQKIKNIDIETVNVKSYRSYIRKTLKDEENQTSALISDFPNPSSFKSSLNPTKKINLTSNICSIDSSSSNNNRFVSRSRTTKRTLQIDVKTSNQDRSVQSDEQSRICRRRIRSLSRDSKQRNE